MSPRHPPALRYGSICSGIEAVSLAWRPLGLEPAWFAEIDPFANAVLAHHYPSIPNLGDMTRIASRVRAGTVSAPDILVGGTPCQSFSVAGARRGLDDPRGVLTLSYVELADAIDQARAETRRSPATIVWENVPGVLSDRTNAFGHFLGALAGECRALEPPGGQWTHAGCVSGPRRRVAWRVLDAQYFGLAQRRRRVFLVASGRDDLDPAAVLFESDSVCRDPSPGYAPWQDVATAAACGADDPGGCADLRSPYGPVTVSFGFGGGNTLGPIDVAACLTAAPGAKHDFDVETFVVQSTTGAISHTLGTANNGKGCSEDGTGRGVPVVAHPIQTTVTAFAQNSRGEVRLEAGDGHLAGALSTGGGKPGYGRPTIVCRSRPADEQTAGNPAPLPILAFTAKDDGADHLENLAPTLRSGNHAASHANAGVMPAIVARTEPGLCAGSAANLVVRSVGRDNGTTVELGEEIANALRAGAGGNDKAHTPIDSIEEHFVGQLPPIGETGWSAWAGWCVRRLMPVECERLQGMPDHYTLVPYRGKPASDAPRYRAIGNSMAVPCVAWIGKRLLQAR